MELWYNIVGWFLAAVAVVGNGLVIFLITTKQRLHTTANWLIFSLPLVDYGLRVLFFQCHRRHAVSIIKSVDFFSKCHHATNFTLALQVCDEQPMI